MNDSDNFSSRNQSYRVICTAVVMHSFGLLKQRRRELKQRRRELTDIAQDNGIVTDENGMFYGSACLNR